MKTQISRDGYRRDKRYSGVYQQQGRLITDSDWNELVDTVKARVDDALVDVVGSGSPKTGAVGIGMSGTTPRITPGTVYAGGVEARVVPLPGITSPFNFNQQADFPSQPPLPAAGTAYRIYADVWDRAVGALEDDGLRDPALHGADTCTRTQTMAQVKWCPVTKNPESAADNPGQGDSRVTIKYPSGGGQTPADACDPKAQEVDPVGGDFLFRVEIHDARWPAGAVPSMPDRVVVKWSRENGAEQYAFADMPDWFRTGPWTYELYDAESEKHLGFHLATTSWTPKRGSLTSTLPQNAAQGTLVRRWEGYLVLVRTGGGVAWDISTANGEKAADTAPGATVQWNDGTMTVSLADLEFTMQVPNRVFLAGDFWSAPVRRATYQAGKELLKSALPQGIVHRYVTLAEVQTNNTLKTRTAQEQRKLAFPRLSELDAGDMGYSTNCSSGLFDSTHDTVKKALDRLCSINGTHVGFTPSAYSSIYQDANPTTTVAQALNLLTDVKSQQISYTPASNPNNVNDVKEALDELYARPVQNGSRVYVGQGGQYISLDLAINDLVGVQGKKDIAIALLPGEQTLPASWSQLDFLGVNLNVLGLGKTSRLKVTFTNSFFFFDRFASVCFQNVHMILGDNTQITFDHCGEVVLLDCAIEGSRLVNKPLILMDEARRVEIRNCLLDSQWEVADSFVSTILGLNAYENITDLFAGGLTEFRTRARSLSQTLHGLPPATRNSLSTGITSRTNSNNSLHVEERATYLSIASQLINLSYLEVFVRQFTETLEHLRRLLYVKNPGTSVQFSIYTGPTLIQGNQIRGVLGFIGLPKAAAHLNNNTYTVLPYVQGNRFSLGNVRHAMQVIGNVMAGMRFGETLANLFITSASNNSYFTLYGPFRTLDVTDNIIENEDNHFLAEEVNLHGNQFTFHPYTGATAAWVIASNATYFGNRSRTAGAAVLNGVAAYNNNVMETGNFRLTFVSYIIG